MHRWADAAAAGEEKVGDVDLVLKGIIADDRAILVKESECWDGFVKRINGCAAVWVLHFDRFAWTKYRKFGVVTAGRE